MSHHRRRTVPLALLLACFFGSGLTGLVYELVWVRRLQLTFGSTTYSVTTVLAAFMAGLGLGSYLVGRRVDRSGRRGVRIYALLELGIGVYALLSLPLLGLAETIYTALQARLGLGQAAAALVKFVITFPVLAIPAGMMGGTLPALVRGLVRQRPDLDRLVGRLYGINTAGAAIGTALTGLVLVEQLGLSRSVWLAASINLAIGALVLRFSRKRRPDAEAEPTTAPEPDHDVNLRDHLRSAPILFCAVTLGATGFLSMLYQIVWTRMLSVLMGSSTYAFTLVLSVFLVGIALGSLAYSRWVKGKTPSVLHLSGVLWALALWATLTVLAMPALPHLTLAALRVPGFDFGRMLLVQAGLAAVVLLVPTLLLGAALPMGVSIIGRTVGRLGQDVGGAYLVNALGSILGSTLTGFALVPLWGVRLTLSVGLLLNIVLVLAGLFCCGPGRWRRWLAAAAGVTALAAVLAPSWPAALMDSGLMFRRDLFDAPVRAPAAAVLSHSPSRLLSVDEGVHATVTVRQFPSSVTLLINGKPDASSGSDMSAQTLVGALPALAHPEPRRVGVIGWGSGVTVATVAMFPAVKAIDVLEIEPAVMAASPHFHPVNNAVERDRRVRLILDDARTYFVTGTGRYDVIVSEPSNPWMAGIASLYAADFYRSVRGRLTEGGVYGQWLQLYGLDFASVALIVRTLLNAFPEVQLWFVDHGNVLFLASDRPVRMPLSRIRQVYKASPALARVVAAYGPGARPAQVHGCFLLDRAKLERLVAGSGDRLMTDDHPTLEYRAVRALYGPKQSHMGRLLALKRGAPSWLPPGADGDAALALTGTSRLLASSPDLRLSITRAGMARFPTSSGVRLEHARALFQDKKFSKNKILNVLSGVDSLADQAETALLRARLHLRLGEHDAALQQLSRMGAHRKVVRLWYTLLSATAAGKSERAWRAAEQLHRSLSDPRDPEALRFPRRRFYGAVQQLTGRTRQFRRAARLLSARREWGGGEYNRLVALLWATLGANDRAAATKAANALAEFNVVDPQLSKIIRKLVKDNDA